MCELAEILETQENWHQRTRLFLTQKAILRTIPMIFKGSEFVRSTKTDSYLHRTSFLAAQEQSNLIPEHTRAYRDWLPSKARTDPAWTVHFMSV